MNFYQFKKVLFEIIQEIIKDPELEENYHIFQNIYQCTHSSEVFYHYIYFQFQLMIYENIAFESKSKKIYWIRNISFIMVDLLGFINPIEENYFINKMNDLIERSYKVIQNPYYHKKMIQSVKKHKRYIQYIFQKISNTIHKKRVIPYHHKSNQYGGSSTISILNKRDTSLFNYYDNIHDFGKFQNISIDYHYYQLKSLNLPEISSSQIEKYFIQQIDKKDWIEIDSNSINDVYHHIYTLTQKYKFVNDASGLLGVYSHVSKGFRNETYEKIYKKIREHKYIINTFANFLDAGNPYQEFIENHNKTITSYHHFHQIIDSVNIYNQCIREICDKDVYAKIELNNVSIQLNIYQKDKKIHTLLLYKNFNSIQTIVNHISMLNKKSKDEKYLLLRLKSMGDRIQAYEVYLTNRGLLRPILFDLKRGDLKEYGGSKKVFLATSDQMLTYFSCCGFDKMNVLSRTSLHQKNYMIVKNDF